MTRYWIGVASHEHVKGGIAGGFAQVCHGKLGPLGRMVAGDWIIYYSPTEQFGGKEACRKFTALGRVKAREPYQVNMSEDFIPWRRDVEFINAHEVYIVPLIANLSFIHNKKQWGFPFRRGFFEILAPDFYLIASKMKVKFHEKK